MDEFLRDIHTMIFKEWILIQDQSHCHIHLDEKHDNIIVIETNYSYSEIIFNRMNIIELSVTNTTTQEIEFYLHFQMKTMKHATELFKEMMDNIQQLVEKPKIKILLSCSGGLTTSYFASKLNEASQLLYYNYEITAIGYNELFNVGDQYDIIMLAPQISYMHAKVQEILKEQIVIKIPPHVFAKYDVAATLALIQSALDKKQSRKDQSSATPLPLQIATHNNTKILSLSIFRNSLRVHIAYRLYDEQNTILLDNEIIKPTTCIQDLYDVVDTVLLQYPDIHTVGISMPGIINDGCIVSANVNGLEDCNLLSLLNARYQQTFVFGNDVNTAAVGYYASQKKYTSLAFLFQPSNYFSGTGIIINGQLVRGRFHLAGETQYLPMDLSNDRISLAKTPEGALELVAKTITSIVSMVSPEVVILCCTMIPHIQELKKEMENYLPKQYIPEIIKVDDLQEYTLLGQLILCIEEQK
ncbi:ROK family protein [Longibaculum muris]|uniref:ROK family protein n=1 Tax=Longibaculum muris TaxID=1796628 RepID=UPI0022E243CB|nr:ROK family protein [Longibaculum muris]